MHSPNARAIGPKEPRTARPATTREAPAAAPISAFSPMAPRQDRRPSASSGPWSTSSGSVLSERENPRTTV